jgi:hypothetical protein
MALGSTQPLTEMSSRNLIEGVKGGRHIGLTTLSPSVNQLSRICGRLDASQFCGPSRPIIGIVLPFFIIRSPLAGQCLIGLRTDLCIKVLAIIIHFSSYNFSNLIFLIVVNSPQGLL